MAVATDRDPPARCPVPENAVSHTGGIYGRITPRRKGMTSEELETIVCKHEMQRLELKESFGVECIETACAFTNAQGGFIVIGVDNDGNPSKHQLRGEGLRDYENKISTATEPSVAVDAEKVEFRGREIVVLRVIENPLKPVSYKGRCYIRKGSVNHQMTPTEIAECHLKSTGASMDAVFVPGATKDDLDMLAYMKECGIPHVVVLTKSDKLNATKKAEALKKIADEELCSDAAGAILYSAETHVGRDDLWGVISSFCEV